VFYRHANLCAVLKEAIQYSYTLIKDKKTDESLFLLEQLNEVLDAHTLIKEIKYPKKFIPSLLWFLRNRKALIAYSNTENILATKLTEITKRPT